MKDKEKLIIITGPTGAGKTKIPFYICVYVKTIGIWSNNV